MHEPRKVTVDIDIFRKIDALAREIRDPVCVFSRDRLEMAHAVIEKNQELAVLIQTAFPDHVHAALKQPQG
jgi:hypothetical protein